MALINLVWHRMVQTNTGTVMRPEFKHVERPARITCSIPRVYERDPAQSVHFIVDRDTLCVCVACNHDPEVWTDDQELWERHPARCNVAYQP